MDFCTAETPCELCTGGMCPLTVSQKNLLLKKLNFSRPCQTPYEEDIPFNVRLTREVLSNHAHNMTRAGFIFSSWSYGLPE